MFGNRCCEMFIKDMLREELENSLRIKKDYERALRKLPKGALVRKVIGGRPYYYLAFRQDGKVRFVYKGKLADGDVAKYEENKKFRARYRERISEVKKQIRFIKKALRGKESV